MGLELMATAGFDPRASVMLWHNMAANADGAPPQIMSTHPSNKNRIKGLQENMAAAVDLYNRAREQEKHLAVHHRLCSLNRNPYHS